MFPIRDSTPSRTFPFVNYLLILANAAVFVLELRLDAAGQLERFIFHYGLIPARFFADPVGQLPFVFTSMFVHAGWMHVIGNMWFLHVFGDNVEDNLGHGRYLIYYLVVGFCAAAAQASVSAGSSLPMVGASGAIAGVLGGYIVLYPRARILTFFVFIIFVRFFEVPAFFFLGLWFVVQAVNGVGTISNAARAEMGGVAWWAHASGFVAGFLAILAFRRR